MCVPGCQEAVRSTLSRRGFFRTAAAAGFAASAVAAPDDLALAAPRARRVVDLTHTMSPEFPTFFGTPGIEFERKFDFQKDGFNMFQWKLIEHAGTHLDAPIHFSTDGATAEKIAPEALVVPLVVINVASRAEENPDYLLSRDDLREWERKHGRIPANACVAMNSGWARHVGSPKYMGKDAGGVFHFPGFSPLAAEWLMKERKVAGIAVDTLSLDNGPSKDFRTHTTWLPSGRWGLENVANLDKVHESGATLVVGLAKVKDATGGPARLIALL